MAVGHAVMRTGAWEVEMNTILWKIYAFFYDALYELLPYQFLIKSAMDAIEWDNGTVRLLDAGCGTGNLELSISRSAADCNPRIEAIDSSSAMLRKARKKMEKHAWAAFKLMDLNERLPYEDEFFSDIVSINSIYATQNPQQVLDEFHRKLKWGGRLILVNPKKNPKIVDVFLDHLRMSMNATNRHNKYILLRNLRKLPQFLIIIIVNLLIVKFSQNNRYHFFDLNELTELITKCHFSIVEAKFIYGNTDIFVVAKKTMPGSPS